ncbi:unnamed protein product [Spodoptera littoralis]|uniref:F-box domain-containing protein n=1 Tax=Spodoptera littoralis TaxID=7109 RepID=A0A9P0IL82_SPOLI|nr:unnamed protein product [Spodoptera littoralis]CAH1647809.1 unnamed protein product [Spodoptera littoralis]
MAEKFCGAPGPSWRPAEALAERPVEAPEEALDEECTEMYFQYLPTEIVEHILKFLQPKKLVQCRLVCTRWMDIANYIMRNQTYWLKHCKREFKNIYETAQEKTYPVLEWSDLYRSLSTWNLLQGASDTITEFSHSSYRAQDLRHFKILPNGIIAVHRIGSVIFYDINTLRESTTRRCIVGRFQRYSENDKCIITLGLEMQLHIIKKVDEENLEPNSYSYENVKLFVLTKNTLYFVNFLNDIFFCDLCSENIIANNLTHMDDEVMHMSFCDGTLNILTHQRRIYSLVKDRIILKVILYRNNNMLHDLNRYNFLKYMDWQVFYNWIVGMQAIFPNAPLRDVVLMKSYGKAYFVGFYDGILHIYYSILHLNEFNIFKRRPVKQYNFGEYSGNPPETINRILNVDVVEKAFGHIVFVALPKNMVCIKLTHNFETELSQVVTDND